MAVLGAAFNSVSGTLSREKELFKRRPREVVVIQINDRNIPDGDSTKYLDSDESNFTTVIEVIENGQRIEMPGNLGEPGDTFILLFSNMDLGIRE